MSTLDLTPLFRSTVGFEHLPTLLTDALQRTDVGYPPYNIEKLGEDAYRIVMAVAGFAEDDIEIVAEQNRLSIRGKAKDNEGATYLHRGIATRAFERHFDLAEHVEVMGASLDRGLLAICLKRELPDRLKPRRIEIDAGEPKRSTPKNLQRVA